MVVITETWLHSDIDDASVFPPSYQVFRKDRCSRGGGVAVLVKRNIPALLTLQIDNHESITLKISCRQRSIVLIAVYRAPDSPHEFWHRLCDHVARFQDDRVIITGDFNLPNIDWNRPYSNP